MKISKSDIHGKLIEQRIQFVRIGFKIREKSLFGNEQHNLGEAKKFGFLNSNYLSKSNLNYLESEDYEGITLLT